jgi:hypothetical protein
MREQPGQGHESRGSHQEALRRGGRPYPGKIGQFEVIADGEKVAERGGKWFTRSFGAGYPDLDRVVEQFVAKQRATGTAR